MKLCEYYKEEFKTNYSKLKNKETRNSQIPNILTLSRLLSPIIIIPLVISGNLKIALIFIILFLSLSLPLLIKDISAKCEYENYFLTLHFVIRLPPPRFTFRDSFRDSLLYLLLTPI